ncbi:unnamed protein product [Phaedon cochleariae]|uniref:Forkhead box protein O n=1 Tax=Phaedon cochleariae TaxID=80249 RepID=A0A9N9WZY2_PHACE|nr:unnamed protein product [Phaedon cochleariae]
MEPVQEQNPPKKILFGRRNICGMYSYADLITQAITSSPNRKLTLSQIYDWMVENVAIFKNRTENSASWKNSVRHNLSLHNKFVRIQGAENIKGSWWTVDPDAKQTKSGRRRCSSMESSKMEAKRTRVRRLLNTRLDHSQQPAEHFQRPMPAYQMNPAFRSRTYSNGSTCSKLSPIPSEETLTTLVQTSPETMEYQHHYPCYQMSPAFRQRAYSSGSSCGKSSPLSGMEVQHNPEYTYELSPAYRARAYSSGSSSASGMVSPGTQEFHQQMMDEEGRTYDVLTDSFQQGLTMQSYNPVQDQQSYSNSTKIIVDNNIGYQYTINVIEPPMQQRPQTLELSGSNSSVDINTIKVETMRTPLECNVDEVIKQELTIEGVLDFN